MSEQHELANWVAEASFNDFSEETISHAKGLLLKTVAGMLAGRKERIGPIVTRYATGLGGPPEAGVVAAGFRTSVETAAFVNATMAHASELEDNQVPEQLSTFWVFPAFFSLAEKLQSSGREMIEAAIISFEVFSRYGRALPAVEMMRLMRSVPPSWYGPVAVAAAAAKMLGLPADQIEIAMSIAATHSCSICGGGHPGTDTHFIESGTTCRNGLLAAHLAKEGVTAGLGVLETAVTTIGDVCFEGQGHPDLLTADLGKPPYRILECCIKKYSACTLTHPAVDAFGLLMQENSLDYEDIESIEVESGEHVHSIVTNRFFPTTVEEARFSTPFLIAEVLLRGKVDENTYSDPGKVRDPCYKAAQQKVSAKILKDVPFGYPGASVTVTRKNGQRLVKHLEDRIGSPVYPLTLEQIADVARPYLGTLLNESQRNRVEEIILHLEKQPDILELMDIITYCRTDRRSRTE